MLFKPDNSTHADAASAPRRSLLNRIARRSVSLLLAAIVIGGIGYVVWTAFQPRQTGQGPRRDLPVPVLAALPRVIDAPVYLEGVGSVRALNTVTVKAQVDGKLLSVNFKEGQDVKQGDVLAEIDPAIYQAQFDQANAKKAQDEAQLANARADLVRYQQLAAANAGSKQQADTQRSTVAQLEAQVKIDQAAIDNATTMLGYTKIIAPLSGRTGLRAVDPGNIVRASDTAGLVVITQVKPIFVQFSLPQQQLPRVNAALNRGPLPVDVFGADGRTVVESGTLQSIDNQVDQTTGSVRLRAQFGNDNLQLWPGQFVNVRLRVEVLQDALVVPTAVVQRGPSGPYAYVIGEGDRISARAVTVVQQNDTEAVIGTGLTEDDRVVTTGFANLAEGTRVIVGRDEAAPVPDLAPRRRQQKGGPNQGGGGPQKGSGQKGQQGAQGDGQGGPQGAPGGGQQQFPKGGFQKKGGQAPQGADGQAPAQPPATATQAAPAGTQ